MGLTFRRFLVLAPFMWLIPSVGWGSLACHGLYPIGVKGQHLWIPGNPMRLVYVVDTRLTKGPNRNELFEIALPPAKQAFVAREIGSQALRGLDTPAAGSHREPNPVLDYGRRRTGDPIYVETTQTGSRLPLSQPLESTHHIEERPFLSMGRVELLGLSPQSRYLVALRSTGRDYNLRPNTNGSKKSPGNIDFILKEIRVVVFDRGNQSTHSFLRNILMSSHNSFEQSQALLNNSGKFLQWNIQTTSEDSQESQFGFQIVFSDPKIFFRKEHFYFSYQSP